MPADPNSDRLPANQEPRASALPMRLQLEMGEYARSLRANVSLDLAFMVYLLQFQRFGFFSFGPVTIDVRLVEDIVERTTERDVADVPSYTDDYVRFSRVLVDEVRRSGRKRVDELHYLLAFMRCDDGLPRRVFSELGVTPEQVELWAKAHGQGAEAGLERLYSPEEAAEYLGVHVQTVRLWIRTGRLPASRLTGQRALRIRASDLQTVLEPVEPGDV